MHPMSRYRYNREYFDGSNNRYFDEREPFRYKDEQDNRYHTVVEGDTYWGLAHRYFPEFERPAGLWWVIAEFQPDMVVDPTIVLEAGKVLVIPSQRLVRQEVYNPARREAH